MICLIAGPQKPPRSYQGLGLTYLAGVLEGAGFEVRICDKYPSSPETDDEAVLDERLAAEVAAMNPSLVGTTIHTPTIVERTRLARHLRERLPDTLLIAGGHHHTVDGAERRDRSALDRRRIALIRFVDQDTKVGPQDDRAPKPSLTLAEGDNHGAYQDKALAIFGVIEAGAAPASRADEANRLLRFDKIAAQGNLRRVDAHLLFDPSSAK